MADLRQACDRCHGMKLRCQKPLGSPVCTRCAKAGTPCAFSPPTRPLRSGPPSHDAAAAAAFDWSALMAVDAGHAPAAFVPQPPPPLFQSSLAWTPPSPANDNGNNRVNGGTDAQSRPALSQAAQLADMMVSLDNLWRKFPGQEVHHIPRAQLRQYADTVGEKFELKPTLELLLEYTQQLAMLYPDIVRTATARAVDPDADACTIIDCVHHDRGEFKPRYIPKVDYALLSLLMACHQRILDILETLTEHGRLCAYMTAQLPKGYDPKFDIPELRIGSFITPKDSAASMVVSLLFELQSLLIKKSKDLETTLVVVRSDSPRQVEILATQCEIVKERGEVTLDQLKMLRDGMVNLGIIR